tara:strand:- start:1276 stop:1470 length:195 start_codon:yes stop_codon:yes gene_type:complete
LKIFKLLKLQETIEDKNNRKIPGDLKQLNKLFYYSESGNKKVKLSEMELNHFIRIGIKKGLFSS